MFWGFSKLSLFKFQINQTACNQCNRCLADCKAGAISVKEKRIDQALCVGCFNCLLVCNEQAIRITPERMVTYSGTIIPENEKPGIKDDRRKFLHQFGSVLFVLSIPIDTKVLSGILSGKEQLLTVFPLGAINPYSFRSKCIGCMLCAQSCPAKIILPSMGAFGGSSVLPVLNFQNNYCLEDCVACSQVCPTGALHEIKVSDKKTTKMASLELNLGQCQIVSEGLECAICAEICPLQAIEMKQVSDQQFPVPVVIQDLCNGCGKCQFRCPVNEKETIFGFNF
jgi:ferredoxin